MQKVHRLGMVMAPHMHGTEVVEENDGGGDARV